jgi:hypothetical protein
MALVEGKWIKKDSQSLEVNASKELQVKVNPTGAIIRTNNGLDVTSGGITNSMLAGNIDDSKLATSYIKTDGSRPYTGNQSMGGNRLTSVGSPIADTDAANKLYVDTVAQGLNLHPAVRVTTTGTLAGTYELAGKTITMTANGALVIDSVALKVNDRVLVKDQTNATENGIYVVSVAGDGSTAAVLTRAADFDGTPLTEVTAGAFTFVTEGNINHDSGWVLITDDPITIDTTELAFEQFSGAGQIIAGAGLTKNGNIIDIGAGNGIQVDPNSITVLADGSTLTVTGSGVKVSSAGITGVELSASVAGAGLSGGAGAALSVNTGNGLEIVADNVTIDLDGGTLSLSGAGLKVSAGGITSTEIASGAVTDVKIDPSVAGAGLIGGNGPLAVGAGDGITVTADAVSVNASQIVDTTKGLVVASNDISVNLDANGGLVFTAGAIGLGSGVAGDGLSITDGVLSVNTGNGTQLVGDSVVLGPLTSNWNTYNGATHYEITGLADPTTPSSATTMSWVQTAITNATANSDVVETFTLSASNITNKYVQLANVPKTASQVVLLIKNAPNQFYGIDYQMDGSTPNRLTWASMGIDGIIEAGDNITVMYNVAV